MKHSFRRCTFFDILLFAGAITVVPQMTTGQGAAGDSSVLRRRYRDGEKISYKLTATNKNRRKTIRYEAQANAAVKKDSAGVYYEEISWSDLIVNESRMPTGAKEFRQILSLDPAFKLTFPDISKVNPILVGPISDLLTFYADLQLAIRTPGLLRPGDHVHIKNSKPNSWADGKRVFVGEDQLDFDITLKEIDSMNATATLNVRHVPPDWSNVNMPVEWMYHPIDSTPNNWVQVNRDEKGVYIGAIGSESFDVEMKINTTTGNLLSGRMNNVVDILQRDCADSALTHCGDTTRYKITRQIELQKIP